MPGKQVSSLLSFVRIFRCFSYISVFRGNKVLLKRAVVSYFSFVRLFNLFIQISWMYNKALNVWSRGKQLVLDPPEFRCENIESLWKIKLFPWGPNIKSILFSHFQANNEVQKVLDLMTLYDATDVITKVVTSCRTSQGLSTQYKFPLFSVSDNKHNTNYHLLNERAHCCTG